MYDDDDEVSFAWVSTADAESVNTPTEQETDEFELLDDDESRTSDWDTSSSGSTSVTPSILDYEREHGRRYHSHMSGRYPLPNDSGEQHREDIEHAMMLELTDGKLSLCDIGNCPRKIIDIGTGTGLWAIDVADTYPSAAVFGTDLSPIQPSCLPPNVRMFVEDCEQEDWGHGSNFDLVHFRGVAGFLQDINTVLSTAYSHIKSGGWIEFQELDTSILCDDGTVKEDDPVRVFNAACAEGIRQCGCESFGNYKQRLARCLRQAGFRGVQRVVKKVPITAWPRDLKLRKIGMLMKANMLASLDAFAAKPLAALGMTPEDRKAFVTQVRESLEDDGRHRYINCDFYYGQKVEAD